MRNAHIRTGAVRREALCTCIEPEYFHYDHCGCDVQSLTLWLWCTITNTVDCVAKQCRLCAQQSNEKQDWTGLGRSDGIYLCMYGGCLNERSCHPIPPLAFSLWLLNEWIQNWNGSCVLPQPILTLCNQSQYLLRIIVSNVYDHIPLCTNTLGSW